MDTMVPMKSKFETKKYYYGVESPSFIGHINWQCHLKLLIKVRIQVPKNINALH